MLNTGRKRFKVFTHRIKAIVYNNSPSGILDRIEREDNEESQYDHLAISNTPFEEAYSYSNAVSYVVLKHFK